MPAGCGFIQGFHTNLGATDHPNSVNLVSTGLPTAEWVDLSATDDPDEVQRIRNRRGFDDTKDRGKFETVGPLTDDDPTPWAFKLQPRTGEGGRHRPSEFGNTTRGSHARG